VKKKLTEENAKTNNQGKDSILIRNLNTRFAQLNAMQNTLRPYDNPKNNFQRNQPSHKHK
jgi:hypothetical protein